MWQVFKKMNCKTELENLYLRLTLLRTGTGA